MNEEERNRLRYATAHSPSHRRAKIRSVPAHQFITQSANAQRTMAELRVETDRLYGDAAKWIEADYTEIALRALAHFGAAEPVNPTPHYSWNMSASTLVAVYKAHVATHYAYDGDLPKHRMQALGYATERGIVFG